MTELLLWQLVVSKFAYFCLFVALISLSLQTLVSNEASRRGSLPLEPHILVDILEITERLKFGSGYSHFKLLCDILPSWDRRYYPGRSSDSGDPRMIRLSLQEYAQVLWLSRSSDSGSRRCRIITL